MDAIQREKNRIQQRERVAPGAFSFCVAAAFVISFIVLPYSLTRYPVTSIDAIFSTPRPPFSFSTLLFFLLFSLGFSLLLLSLRKTQRQKQSWLNEYGQQIQAVVSKHPEENALVIGGSVRRRNAASWRYLHWQDPHTVQRYSFYVNTRFSSALRNLPEGTLYPVQFDPDDLAFFVISEK